MENKNKIEERETCNKPKIRLRAAPSPTGKAHIGNVRTYFMAYAYAKKYGGKFIFRIEDTDQKRSVPNGTEALLEAYAAYGIVADEDPVKGGEYGPYVQTQRKDIYKKYAEQLIEKGQAYYCFCSEERLTKMREIQKASKMKPMYDRHCRNISLEEAKKRVAAGEPHVIRMKFPTEGFTECEDVIYGKVKFKNSDIEDQVLVKASGIPTYHLAVVVDDHLMKITTATRGTEWFPSFPKHAKLYEYLGWQMPQFVHLPVILNPDGKGKLSKRHGALPAVSYLRKGYLAEAVLNYVMLCGWAPAPEEAHQDEIYTVDELIKLFDFARVHKAGARYDQRKLDYINGKHIRNLDLDTLANRVVDWAENLVLKSFITDQYEGLLDWEVDLKEQVSKYLEKWKSDMGYFKKALALEHDRITVLSEIPYSLDFFYDENLSWEDTDWNTKNHTFAEIAQALEDLLPKLDIVLSVGFDHEKWEQTVRGYADEITWKHGDLFLAVRSAVTGRLQSPPLLESIEVMGWGKAKSFIVDGISWLKSK